jgi:dihydroorotase
MSATTASKPRAATRRKKQTVAALPGAYDVVLKGGRVIDPATGTDGIMDVAIAGGKIAAVGTDLPVPAGARRIDAAGLVVAPGLIDTHAHIYEHVTGDFGLNPDMVGVRSGVTTVVDQGGASALTFGGFRQYVVEPAQSRVLSFISAYLAGGLMGHRYVDLYGPTGINVAAIVKTARENPTLIKGIKAHAEPGGFSRWGLESLKLAKQAGRELGLPVYIHLGRLWPQKEGVNVDPQMIIEQVVPLLDAGDVLAHPFTRYPSGFVSADGSVHPLVFEALERGVTIDVGRGAHFSFDNARAVIAAGILPTTLGADLHGYNIKFPEGGRWYRGVFTDTEEMEPPEDASLPFSTPYGIYHAMSELMALGVSLPQVVAMATSNAARLLRMEDQIGALKPGMEADISVFRVLRGEWVLRDSNGAEVITHELLHPEQVVRAGKVIDIDSPLLPDLRQLAA